jgi:hypothetical protein
LGAVHLVILQGCAGSQSSLKPLVKQLVIYSTLYVISVFFNTLY